MERVAGAPVPEPIEAVESIASEQTASSAKRNVTLLRLLSWLSFRLEPAVSLLRPPCSISQLWMR